MKNKNPSLLVRCDIDDLLNKIGSERRMEISQVVQKAQRRRLPGAVKTQDGKSSLEVKVIAGKLRLYWLGGNGTYYQGVLVGVLPQKNCAKITEVAIYIPLSSYEIWHAENGPWF